LFAKEHKGINGGLKTRRNENTRDEEQKQSSNEQLAIVATVAIAMIATIAVIVEVEDDPCSRQRRSTIHDPRSTIRDPRSTIWTNTKKSDR